MRFESVGKWIDDHGAELLSASINGIGFATVGYLIKIDRPINSLSGTHSHSLAFWLALLLLLIGIILNVIVLRKKKRISKISQEKDIASNKVKELEESVDNYQAQQTEFLNLILSKIFYQLGFDANERISIYRHDKDEFVLISRYSQHPDFKQIRRTVYPENEGFINKAWVSQTGQLLIEGLPDFEEDNKVYYKEVCNHHQIPKGVFNSIRMKSRSYFLYCITDFTNLHRIALIVVESLHEQSIDSAKIVEAFDSEKNLLVSLVNNVRALTDKQSEATEMGF